MRTCLLQYVQVLLKPTFIVQKVEGQLQDFIDASHLRGYDLSHDVSADVEFDERFSVEWKHFLNQAEDFEELFSVAFPH